MSKFKGTHWEIALPPDWVGQHDGDCAILFNPQGVGALQVRAHTKHREVTEKDLRDLASQHMPAGARMDPADAGDFSGFTLTYAAQEVFWQHWYVSSGNQALMITYTCGKQDKEREIAQVREMLASLSST